MIQFVVDTAVLDGISKETLRKNAWNMQRNFQRAEQFSPVGFPARNGVTSSLVFQHDPKIRQCMGYNHFDLVWTIKLHSSSVQLQEELRQRWKTPQQLQHHTRTLSARVQERQIPRPPLLSLSPCTVACRPAGAHGCPCPTAARRAGARPTSAKCGEWC